MYSFFQRLRDSAVRFFQGRYGIDNLSYALVIASCVLTLLGSLLHLGLFRLLSTVLLLYTLYRMCSRNFYKRRQELGTYLRLTQKVRSFFALKLRMYRERKEKKYFQCPNCKTYLSVPKGKGKIRITCRKCSHQFVKKS